MSKNAAQILADPDWMAYRYSSSADQFLFRHLTRDQRANATFLTDEYLGEGTDAIGIDRREAIALAPAAAPAHFIFHSAFCCSTLVARVFDIPGVATSLKEPMVFNDLAGALLRRELAGAALAERIDHGLQLLARPHNAGEAVIIKPSNVSNGLIPVMLGMYPASQALLLYAPLEIFLKSIAKKGIDGRLWVRDLMVKLVVQGLIDVGLDGEDYLRLTDLQSAAVGWLAQQALFARVTAEHGTRIKTLSSEELLANPADTVRTVAAHFGLRLDEAQIGETASGPAFNSHSKTGATFGARDRDAEYDAAAAQHKDEIEKVLGWAEVVARNIGLPQHYGLRS